MDANLAEIKALFPTLTDDELVIAQEKIDRYLEVIWDIWQEKERRDAAPFDAQGFHSYDEGKVDSPKQTHQPKF